MAVGGRPVAGCTGAWIERRLVEGHCPVAPGAADGCRHAGLLQSPGRDDGPVELGSLQDRHRGAAQKKLAVPQAQSGHGPDCLQGSLSPVPGVGHQHGEVWHLHGHTSFGDGAAALSISAGRPSTHPLSCKIPIAAWAAGTLSRMDVPATQDRRLLPQVLTDRCYFT
jgi:hypothetical protein